MGMGSAPRSAGKSSGPSSGRGCSAPAPPALSDRGRDAVRRCGAHLPRPVPRVGLHGVAEVALRVRAARGLPGRGLAPGRRTSSRSPSLPVSHSGTQGLPVREARHTRERHTSTHGDAAQADCTQRSTRAHTHRAHIRRVGCTAKGRRRTCHCPGRKPPFSAVKRPARPYKSAIQNGFPLENANGA
jgi:hypothetical protein